MYNKSRIICLLVFLSGCVLADVFTATSSSASIREGESDERILDLTDSVEVSDGSITVTSDAATIWQISERAVFTGNVSFASDTLSGTSDYLEYDRASGEIIMTGNAILFDGDAEVHAGEIVFYTNSKKAIAKDSVVMTGEWPGIVSGQYAMYDYDRKSIFITADPLLVHTENEDTMFVTADRLEYFREGNRAEAQGNAVVTIPVREFTAVAEYLHYYENEDRLEFFGGPELVTPDGELSGDEIVVYMADGMISFIFIEGNATGFFSDTNEDPPAETWFTSQTADFFFVDEELDSLYISGSADLVYKAGGEAAQQQEINTVKGDIFIITFEDGSAVSVTASGNVNGTYSYRKDSGE